MWDCDWFRRFESRYFADDFFTDFEEEMQEEIEDTFADIDDQGPRELIQDYQILEDVGVREFSSFVSIFLNQLLLIKEYRMVV